MGHITGVGGGGQRENKETFLKNVTFNMSFKRGEEDLAQRRERR